MSAYTGQKNSSEAFFYPLLAAMLIFGLWFALRVPILYLCFLSSFYIFGVYEQLTFLMTATELQTLKAARRAIPTIDPSEHGLRSLFMLMELHGYILRWGAIPFMLWLGWWTKKHTVRFKYRRHIKNVYDLIEIQAKHFPASAIIRGKNLLSHHPYIGPWATYSLPLDFALDHLLLWTSTKRVTENDRVDESKMVPIPAFTPDQKVLPFPEKRKLLPSYRYVLLNVERANNVFSSQLGELWTGPQALPPLERALYAAFCAQASGKNAECWAMIEQLAFSFKEGKYDQNGKLVTPHYANTKGTDELLAKYGDKKAITDVSKLHAHKNNVLHATLAIARQKGRLTHANFLWLKPVNRTLWYVLCGQGGQVPYWEGAGPWAHAQVESKLGKKISRPMVAGAVHALHTTMSREHWIDPGEYSEEHQRKLVMEANELLSQAEKAKAKPRGAGQQSMLGSSFATPPPRRPLNEDDEP